MSIRVSFIIPCYNVSNYIELCLDSILSCPIPKDEYEILCIDDCSTDNTKEKLIAYAKDYSNLHIIQHSINLGPGASRNDGISSAIGEYIWFVDADDTVQTDSIEALINKALCNKVDVLCFNYSDIDNVGELIGSPEVFKDTNIKSGLEFTYDTFGNGLIYHIGYPVRFLTKREYLIDKKLSFPQGVYFEDTVWMPKLLLLADKVQGCDIFGYNYWHHGESIMGNFASQPSAKHIYDWCLSTGLQLYEFSKELRCLGNEYHEYSDIIEKYSITRYVNYLPILLGRAEYQEVKCFYKLNQMRDINLDKVFKDVLSHASILTKFLLTRPFGKCSAFICSFYYKLAHKK